MFAQSFFGSHVQIHMERLCEAPASHLPGASELKLEAIAKGRDVHILAGIMGIWVWHHDSPGK